MFKIETYTNPQVFYNTLTIQSDELHITSIPVLAMHMKEQASKKQSVLKRNVYIYHHFYQAIYPKVNHAKYILDMKQVLRRLMRETISDQVLRERMLAQIQSIHETYRYWLMIDLEIVQPLSGASELEKCRIELFKKFKQDEQVQAFIEEVRQLHTTQSIAKVLEETSNRKGHEVPVDHYQQVKRIYIYSMNYLEPVRYQFFEKLVAWGYEVIFRIPYDPQFPRVYKAWRDVYSKLVPFEAWKQVQQSEETSSMLAFLEGTSIPKDEEKVIKVHHFNEPTDFKAYLAKYPLDREALELLACEEGMLNDYFRDEIDPDRQIGHIFETPLGRFLRSLYRVQVNNDDFEMNYTMYKELMTSGIVNIRPQKGRALSGLESTSLLSDLNDYMEGVESLGAIQERLSRLKELIEVSEQFDDLGRSKVDRNHVKRYLQNPLRAFGFVNLQNHELTINQLIALTDVLSEILQKLLKDYAATADIKAHIKETVQLMHHSVAYEMCPEALVGSYNTFLQQFARLRVNVYEHQELIEYISVLGKIQSEKHVKGQLILIKGIEHALGVCVNDVKEIFVCDLSTTAMNQYVGERTRRIELRTLDQVVQYVNQMPSSATQASILHALELTKQVKMNIQNFVKFNIMLLLTYYQGTLHLGWTKHMHVHDTEWYLLSIIRQLYRTEEVVESTVEVDLFEGLSGEKPEERPSDLAIKQMVQQVAPFAYNELEQCPRKFYYTNLLHHYPVYQEDFTQRIAFGWLGKMLQDQYQGKEQVRQQFFPLFPQWTEALKENLVATTEGCKLDEYEQFENVKFPKDLQRLWILGRKYHKEVKLETKQQVFSDHFNEGQMKRAEPGKRCYFCPHQYICQEGTFGIDHEY